MKRKPRTSSRRRLVSVAVPVLLAMLMVLTPILGGPTVFGHNLQTKMVYMFFDPDTQAVLDARMQDPSWVPGTPLLQVGDELGLVIKVVPRDGTNTGVGGHIDFYVPDGVQVVDVAYLQPTDNDPTDGITGYDKVAMKGQSPIATGAGPIAAKTTVELIGLPAVGPNVNGVTENPVVPTSGLHRGTIAGVYGDTGIFYATDPDTAFNSWNSFTGATDDYCGLVGTLPPGYTGKTITNNSGDVFVPCNKWDAGQMYAWGVKGTTYTGLGATGTPIVDYGDGRGNAPWGFASGVAGPQSGYGWYFNWDEWRLSAQTAADMRAAMGGDEIGPWKRIQYPGSRVSYDQPGAIGTTLGFASIDASQLGYDLSSQPLPVTTSQTDTPSPKAIRWAVGQLTDMVPEFAWVKIKVNDATAILDPDGCPVFRSDTFGGDAGGTDNGKDHLWRYYEPSIAEWNGCLALGKPATKDVVAVGEYFQYKIKLYNAGTETFTNVVVRDTLPSGVTFISAVPAQNSGPNPLVWSDISQVVGDKDGLFEPGEYFEATVTVKATGSGLLDNTVVVDTDTLDVTTTDTTTSGNVPVLSQTKSVSPTSVAPGGTGQYTLVIDNIGGGPTGSPVQIRDYLEPGLTYQSLDSVTVDGASYLSTTTVNSSNPQEPVFTVPASIPAGGRLVLTFTAKVSATAPPGTYCNTYTTTQNGIPATTGSQACLTVGGGKIGDTIYRDWNGNGTQDPVDEGVEGVTVDLYSCTDATYTNCTFAQNTDTDPNGNYLFEGLAEGYYRVVVTDLGGVLTGYTNTGDPDGGTAGQSELFLADGQQKLNQDFGYQPAGTGVIGDTVWNDNGAGGGTIGNGIQDGTEPGIANVTVRLYEDTNGNGVIDPDDALVATDVTDASGNYSFTGLAEGLLDYIVKVDESDSDLTGSFTVMGSSTDNPHPVTDLTGTYNLADFGYYEVPPATISGTAFQDENYNGTYDAGTDVLITTTVTVNLYDDLNGNGVLDAGEPLVATTTTDANGDYSFTNLGPGDYIVDIVEDDADVPTGYVPTTDLTAVTLAEGGTVDDADFPFVKYLTKSVTVVGGGPAGPGSILEYTLTPYYPGPDLLTNVVVQDAIPEGTTYVPGSANAGGVYQPVPDQVEWSLGSNTPDDPGVVPGVSSIVHITSTFDSVRGGTTLNPAKPAGTVEGDLMVAGLALNGGSNFPAITVPSGWTLIRRTDNGTDVGEAAYYKVAGAAEPASYTWSVGNNQKWSIGISTYRNVDTTNPIDTDAAQANPNSTSAVAPSINTTVENTMLVAIFASKAGAVSGATAAPPPGMTEVYDINTQNGGGNEAGVESAYATFAGPGATGTRTATLTASALNVGHLIALKPATAVGTTTTLSASPMLVTGDGSVIFVEMTVTAEEADSGVDPDPLTPVISGGGTGLAVSCLPADQTAQSVAAGGSVSFSWTCTVDNAGTAPGSVVFQSTPTGDLTYAQATSNSVLTTPPLVFRVTVDSPQTVAQVDNYATLQNNAYSTVVTDPTAQCYAVADSDNGTNDLDAFSFFDATTGVATDLGLIYYSTAPTTTRADHIETAEWSLDGTALYVVDRDDAKGTGADLFGTLDPATALFTPIGNVTLAGTDGALEGLLGSFTVADIDGLAFDPFSGILYAVHRREGTTTELDVLLQIDPATGRHVEDAFGAGLDYLVIDSSGLGLYDIDDISVDPVSGALYATLNVASDSTYNDRLVIIDPATGTVTDVGRLIDGSSSLGLADVEGLSFGGDGVLYAATADGDGTAQGSGNPESLWIIDTTTAEATLVGSLVPSGTAYADYEGLACAGGSFALSEDPIDSNTVSTPLPTYSVSGTVWYDDNVNQTIDAFPPDGGYIEGAVVIVYEDTNGNGVLDVGEPEVASTTTDANGYYQVDGLPPGDYVIDVYEASITTDESFLASTPENLAVTITNADITDQDFGYFEGAYIGDTVFHDVNRNGIYEPNGADGIPGTADDETGLDGVTVTLTGTTAGGDPVSETYDTGSGTLPAGEYLFLVPPGDYTVTYDFADVTAIDPTLTDTTTATSYDVTVAAGDEFLDADFGVDNSGAIGDFIWNDANGNGAYDAGEGGLPGVTVALYSDADGDPATTGDQTFVGVTATDANGAYLFEGLPDGNYVVKVDTATVPSGYTNTYDYDDGAVSPDDQTAVTVSGGATVDLADFGYAPPTPWNVSGTIFDDFITTNGAWDPGEGLEGVTVYLYDGYVLVATTTTDANGDYTFPGIVDGDYVIRVDTDTLPSTAYYQTVDPDGTLNNEHPITVSGADVIDKDFGYEKELGSIAGTVCDGDGDGLCEVGESGLPGVTVILTYAGDDGIMGTADDVVTTTTTDAFGDYSFIDLEPGLYQVEEVNPYGYDSLADADGGDPDNISPVILDFGIDGIPNTADDRMDKVDRDFEDTSVSTIGDRVWLDEDGDGVQDAGEAGIANVTVELYAAGDIPGVDTPIATATTDADGGYTFEDVPAGTYTVYVDGTTLPTGLTHVTYDEDDGTTAPDGQTSVTVAAGDEYTTADFGYNYAPTSDVTGGTNTGAIGDRLWIDANGDGVQDPGEPGLEGVTVKLYSDPDGDGVYDTLVATTTTNPDGSYVFDGLAAGAYVVEVNDGTTPAGYTQTGDPDGTLDNRSEPILLAPGDVYVNADFGYDPAAGSTIGDTIYFDADGDGVYEPNGNDGSLATTADNEYGIAGVTVALIDDLDGDGVWDAGEPIIATTTTGADGSYSFPGLPAGDYIVWVNDTDNVLGELSPVGDPDEAGICTVCDEQSSVTVDGINDYLNEDFGYTPEGQNVSQGLIGDTIFLDRNGDNIADAGEGLEGVTVNLYDSTGTVLLGSTVTDENGHYSFGDLDDGTYVVRVDTGSLPGGLTNTYDPDATAPLNESTVTISDGNIDLDQDFGYQGTNTVSGTIWTDTDADGFMDAGETDWLAGVTVVLRDSAGNIVATTTTDASGNFSFAFLPDGTYTVDVTDENNVLDGYWHSLGTANTDGYSQTDPLTVTLTGGTTIPYADFGYYAEPASLGNFVWDDLNGNGIQDAGEPGISDAEVTLTVTYPNGEVVTVTTTTDASGYYSFENLLLDENYSTSTTGDPTVDGLPRYKVSVASPSGMAPTLVDQGVDEAVDSEDPYGELVLLAQGQTDDTIDFGFVQAGSIGDYIWVDMDRDGLQDAGEPGIANVKVTLTGTDDNGNPVTLTTYTDANGYYSFEDVPPGTYTVTVDDTTLPAGLAANQTYDRDGTLDDATTVTVAPGDEVPDADFGYAWTSDGDTTGALGDRIWIDANGDGVQDPGELGLEGVEVQLYDATGFFLLATTTTDADGNYMFDGLAEGNYVVKVVPPAGYTQTGDPDYFGESVPVGDRDNQTTTPVTVTPGTVNQNVDFGYQPPAEQDNTIGDTIYFDVDANGIYSPTLDSGIANVSVDLISDVDGDGMWDQTFEVIDGRIDINDNGFVTILDDGILRGVTIIDGRLDLDNDGFITVADDGTFYGVTVIDGQLDLNGDGTVNATDDGATVGEPIIATDVTDTSGQYLFEGVPDGNYIVSVNDTSTVLAGLENTGDPDGGFDSLSAVDLDSGSLSATGVSELNEDFGYAPSGHDAGEGLIGDTIYLDRDGDGYDAGEGVEGVRVELYDAAGTTLLAVTYTDENGNYAFGGLDATGTYVVKVDETTLPGGGVGLTNTYDPDGALPPSESTVDLSTYTGGIALDQDFGYALQTNANTIAGTIWNDPDQDGILDGVEVGRFADVTVALYEDTNLNGVIDAGDTLVGTTTTNANGNYSFTGLPDGTYLVDVTDDGGVLNGWSDSDGPTPGADNNSQVDPYQVTVAGGVTDSTADFGYYLGEVIAGLIFPDPLEVEATPGTTVYLVQSWENFGSQQDRGNITVYDIPSDWGLTIYRDSTAGAPLPGAYTSPPASCPSLTCLLVATYDTASPDGILDDTDIISATNDTGGDGVPDSGDLAPAGQEGDSTTVILAIEVPTTALPGTYVLRERGSSNNDWLFKKATFPFIPYNDDSVYHDDALKIVTIPGATVGDRVWLDEDGDGLQDAGESGIANLEVTLTGTDAYGNVITLTTTTDANGEYLFTDVPTSGAGGYTITVAAPTGLEPTYDEDGIGTAGTTVISVTAGDDYLTADFGYNWVPPADSTNPALGATGAIGDRVWIDTNGDGVQDPGELGLEGVSVTIYYDPDGDGIYDTPYTALDAYGNPITTTVTGPDGSYIFDGLEPGSYVIVVNDGTDPAGYTQTGDPDEGGTCVACDNQSEPIVVAPGDVYVNADFGYDPAAGSTIGNQIYLDANGDGTYDPADGDKGISGVTVVLLDQFGNVVATTTTDEFGNYEFTGVPAGTYTVWVNDTGDVLGELAQTGDPDATLDDRHTLTVDGTSTYPANDFGYAPPGHDPTTGLIGDTIFLDRDGDGLADVGEGLEGVTVYLYDESGTILLATTTTDENGNYYFGGLNPGNIYTLVVDETTLPNGGLYLSNTIDPDGGNDSTSQVQIVSPDLVFLDEDFGYTSALTPGAVQGTIWVDTDADGALDTGEAGRYEGVTVELLDAYGNVVATTTTDANGYYSFGNVPPGLYTVDVTDENHVLDGTWHSLGTDSQTDPNPVAVFAGSTTTSDFGYYSEPATLGNWVWEDLDRDGIQDAGEPGLAGVEVTLRIEYPNGDVITQTTTTDALGYYSFDNLLLDESYDGVGTPGVDEPIYTISVAAPDGYGATKIDEGTDDTVDSDDPAGQQAFPAQGVTDDSYDFGFIPAGVVTIGDRLWLDENGDGIQDAGESGIAGVVITLTNGVETYTTTTDADGGYLFTVESGDWTILVDTTTLPAGLDNPTGDPDGTFDNQTSVTLLPDDEYTTADFGYNWVPSTDSTDPGPGAFGAIGDRVWIDANGDGVQDAGEAGLAGITVDLYYDSNGDGLIDALYATTTTGPDGSYVFTDLPAGIYEVVVNGGAAPAGYTQTGDPDGTLDNQTTSPIVLAPGDVVTTADFGYDPTTPGSTIGDQIYLDADGDGLYDAGEPGIPGVTVVLLDGAGNVIATTTTDENGNYSFDDLPAGTYTVWVNDTDNVLGELAQTGDPDATLDDRHTLTVDGTSTYPANDFGYAPPEHSAGDGLIGNTIFLDADGSGTFSAGDTGLEGVTVELYDSTGTTLLATTTTDENGNYYFGNLNPAGTYTVVVDETTLPATVSNTVDPDGILDSTTVVDLLAEGGISLAEDFGYAADTPNTVSGTIWNDADANGTLDETGAGLEGVTVALYDGQGNLVATTTTDVNGGYSFSGLPNGTYTVDVTDENNVLDGAWHSLGTPDTDGQSQPDPLTVTLDGNETINYADFGYYSEPASLGNYVWDDVNQNGIQDDGATGISNVLVYLTITYPNGDKTKLQTTTDTNGYYSFDNLLLDESYDGTGIAGQEEPTYVISVDQSTVPTAYVAAPQNATTEDLDSDDPVAQTATVVQGELNNTYDFGFYGKPTGFDLLSFTATGGKQSITLNWETDSETDNLGFNLYRATAEDGERTQLNETLIPTLVPPGSPYGALYEYVDDDQALNTEETYYYWLEAVNLSGETELHGPVSAELVQKGIYRIFLPLVLQAR